MSILRMFALLLWYAGFWVAVAAVLAVVVAAFLLGVVAGE
jgi:hypothetical protein